MASYDQNKAFRAYPSARLLRSFGFSPQVFLDTSCLVPLTTLHSHQKLSFKFSGPGLDRRQVQSSHTASAKLFGATPSASCRSTTPSWSSTNFEPTEKSRHHSHSPEDARPTSPHAETLGAGIPFHHGDSTSSSAAVTTPRGQERCSHRLSGPGTVLRLRSQRAQRRP